MKAAIQAADKARGRHEVTDADTERLREALNNLMESLGRVDIVGPEGIMEELNTARHESVAALAAARAVASDQRPDWRVLEREDISAPIRPAVCTADAESLRAAQCEDDEIAVHLEMHAAGRCPHTSGYELAEYQRRVVRRRASDQLVKQLVKHEVTPEQVGPGEDSAKPYELRSARYEIRRATEELDRAGVEKYDNRPRTDSTDDSEGSEWSIQKRIAMLAAARAVASDQRPQRDDRKYTIYVCPDCGSGCQLTPGLPGCGPRQDGRRSCGCGFKGYFVPLTVTASDQGGNDADRS